MLIIIIIIYSSISTVESSDEDPPPLPPKIADLDEDMMSSDPSKAAATKTEDLKNF